MMMDNSAKQFRCLECGKEFDSHKGLNGHKRIHGPSQGKQDSRKRKETFDCLYCGTTNKQSVRLKKKFCNSECSTKYTWEKKHLPRILEGTASHKAVRRYLLATSGERCFQCGISEWRGEKLSLQLDHIDGNSDNNQLDNCRLLCPNCHSLTPTWCKSKGNQVLKDTSRNRYIREYYGNNRDKWR